MKYATWVLSFEDPNYGTGPEASIIEQGGTAQSAHAEGEVSEGARILGYFTGDPTGLEMWQFTELSQQEALDFVLNVDKTAYIADDGSISIELDV
jgi:hypothetical protein